MPFKNVKTIKEKVTIRNCFRLMETRETLHMDLGPVKDIVEVTDEI